MTRTFFILLTVVGMILNGYSQDEAFGLWVVESVQVGDRNMTPVAKWFEIKESGEVAGGNGRIINIMGTWSLADGAVLFTDESGWSDPYGAFEYSVSGDVMTWQRVEDGASVFITMNRSSTYPEGPWDLAEGGWANMANRAHTLYMGWDRVYRLTTKMGRKRGIWHIDAHNPQLKLVADDGVIEDWSISFPTDSTMQWTADLRDTLHFVRMMPD